MPIPLPPLPSLRLFEAAARHESFRKAAEELGLTASAVSHGVDSLEKWLASSCSGAARAG
jgi:LysR family glycine cleavage system transcriptional activator